MLCIYNYIITLQKIGSFRPSNRNSKNRTSYIPIDFHRENYLAFYRILFIGAISSSFTRGMKVPEFFNKSFTFGLKKKENKKNNQITQDTKKKISKN